MTLNGVIALVLRYFTDIALLADYVVVVDDRPIMCAKYCFFFSYIWTFDPRSSATVSF